MAKKRGLSVTLRHFFEFALLQSATGLIRNLSGPTVVRLGRLLGWLAYRGAGKRRPVALTNLNIAFGDTKSPQEKKEILQNSFKHHCVSILQCLWLTKDTENRVNQLLEGQPRGLDILSRCLERKKGIFFLTSHYGNWEFLGIHHGFLKTCRLHSIVRRLDNPRLEMAALKFRQVSGNGIIYREDSALKMAHILKKNESVAVMLDQNTAKGGIFVDFFEKKAATPRSVALLSYRTGAAILPLFCYPTSKGTYRIEYGPELQLEKSGDKEKDIARWTRECQRYIEGVIRKQPEPWMWVHRRWKTRPPEENTSIY